MGKGQIVGVLYRNMYDVASQMAYLYTVNHVMQINEVISMHASNLPIEKQYQYCNPSLSGEKAITRYMMYVINVKYQSSTIANITKVVCTITANIAAIGHQQIR